MIQNPEETAFASRASVVWTGLLLLVLVWLAAVLSHDISRPWIRAIDYNGAVWSQSAHNILRAGLLETSGAASGFYFGPLPIPPWGYYLHHPPLLHLAIAGAFSLFGEHEWVARLVPIVSSVISAVLLWLLAKSCVGARAATFSVAIFASLPMEIRYGRMVNFEPVVLMLILGALFCIRQWEKSCDVRWKIAAVGCVLIGLWVDWAMDLFVIGLCVCCLFRARGRGRSCAWPFLIAAIVSGALYVIRIRVLRADAWSNLTNTFFYRVGVGSGGHFTEAEWLHRVGSSLIVHFLPAGWLLAAVGAFLMVRGRWQDEGLRWLGWACAVVMLMDVVFVAAFQNDSYIHQYIGFYFLAPLALMGGMALDRLFEFAAKVWPRPALSQTLAGVCVCILLVGLAICGDRSAGALQGQFRILDYASTEPPYLIPELGHAIRTNFSPGTRVLCNFLPDYGPQLPYYAQRELLNNLSDYETWKGHLGQSDKPIGGVVWMGSRGAKEIVRHLPVGTKRFVKFGGISFCLWKPLPAG